MGRRMRLEPHSAVEELERRYRAAKEPHERRWWQILRLLAEGQTAAAVAESMGDSRYWIGQLLRRDHGAGPEAMRKRRCATGSTPTRLGPPRCCRQGSWRSWPRRCAGQAGARGRRVARPHRGRVDERQAGAADQRAAGLGLSGPAGRQAPQAAPPARPGGPGRARGLQKELRPRLRDVAAAYPRARVAPWAVAEHRIGLKPLLHTVWCCAGAPAPRRPGVPAQHRHDWRYLVGFVHPASGRAVFYLASSDFYGPHVTNQLIRRALHPYPDGLVIVTKIGFRRGDDGLWLPDFSAEALTAAVHDNLHHLGLDALDVVNLRVVGPDGPVEEPLATLVNLQRQGLIRHIGLGNVTRAQVRRGAAVADLVCVHNEYNLVHRHDDSLIDELAGEDIAYTPFFPLGGFTPLQSSALSDAAARLGATPLQVALAWLLQRSPNILLFPGTSSVEHLRENVQATSLALPEDVLADLHAIGARP